MNPTCTFPNYPYRILAGNESIQSGDKANFRNPSHRAVDYWHTINLVADWEQVRNMQHQNWIFIRPL